MATQERYHAAHHAALRNGDLTCLASQADTAYTCRQRGMLRPGITMRLTFLPYW